MFKENEKIYFVDTFSGTIREGKFIENNSDGLWINLSGDSLNTFVYSDIISERVFNDFSQAESSLKTIRDNMKTRLSNNNFFVKDIIKRLEKSEGPLYVGVINEILSEKTGPA
jgi:hypothetical protein